MVKRRIPLKRARAQSPFSFSPDLFLTQKLPAVSLAQQAQAHVPTLCIPSFSMSFCGHKGRVMSAQQHTWNHEEKGTVV